MEALIMVVLTLSVGVLVALDWWSERKR